MRKLLFKLEKRLRTIRLKQQKEKNNEKEENVVNNSDQWAKVYTPSGQYPLAEKNPIYDELIKETKRGDIVLETGIGYATTSLALAQKEREVWLYDFSDHILKNAESTFEKHQLSPPKTFLADLTKGIPLHDKEVDISWSGGVLEHWTDDELLPIVREIGRVTKRKVISFVPNANCVFYRVGKRLLEKNGLWPYGREIPRRSLRSIFEAAGLKEVTEKVIWPEVNLELIRMYDPILFEALSETWHEISLETEGMPEGQGYLICTIGHV